MANQFNFGQDAATLQQQLALSQIARLFGTSAQSAAAGFAGIPGDLSNMFAGHMANQPSQTALPTYETAQNTFSNYTGIPPTSSLPPVSDMPGMALLRLAAQAPHLFGQAMQNQNGQAPQAPSGLQSLLQYLRNAHLTGTTPAY